MSSTSAPKKISTNEKVSREQCKAVTEELQEIMKVFHAAQKALIKQTDKIAKDKDVDDWEDDLCDMFTLQKAYIWIAQTLLVMEKRGVKLPEIDNEEITNYMASERRVVAQWK